ETTQSHIPGGQDVGENGLWIKLLNSRVWRSEGVPGLRMVGSEAGQILVGSPQPLEGLYFDLDRNAPAKLEVNGQEYRPSLLRPDGSILFDVPLKRARAVHPMWWTWDDFYLYELDLRMPGGPAAPVGVRILPSRDLIQRSGR
ncbi:MAG TPA: hypothetical protein VHN15_07205, partial [Thermoanaerobaculia bacterium]|nr:hypothetical protein [Thermoanaerobaculia bacterium]